MKTVLVWALAAGVVAGEMPPPAPGYLSGFASGYAPGVMESTVRYRLDNDVWRVTPPWDWYYRVEGTIATNDCSQVGQIVTLIDPSSREYDVLVADCAGKDSAGWMTENRIIAELDWNLWCKLVEQYGRPLRIDLR
jgi:hypothetical protein